MLRGLAAVAQVWLRALKFRLSRGDSEGARKLLDRSLQVRTAPCWGAAGCCMACGAWHAVLVVSEP